MEAEESTVETIEDIHEYAGKNLGDNTDDNIHETIRQAIRETVLEAAEGTYRLSETNY